MRGGILHQIGDGSDELTTRGEPLNEAKGHHHDRCGYSDGCVGGEESHQRRRDGHDGGGDEKGNPPAIMVGYMAEDGTAAKTHDVTCGKDTENRDDRNEAITLWKEEFPKNWGHHSVKSEVIPLHHVAGHSGDNGDGFERGRFRSSHARVSLMRTDGLGKNAGTNPP